MTRKQAAVVAMAGGLGLLAVWVLRGRPDSVASRSSPVAAARSAPALTGGFVPAADAFIEGTILTATGAPMPGAGVVALDAGGGPSRRPLAGTAEADASGAFRLGPLPAGYYRLTAAADGYLPKSRELAVKEGQTLRGIQLALRAGGLVLSGQVLDAGTGAIAGARVRVQLHGQDESPQVALARTDGSGGYRITVPPGFHALMAEAEGYAPEETAVWMVGATRRDFWLIPAAGIAGQVARRGAPVAQARVQAASRGFRAEAETDAEGRFRLEALEPGDYHLEARAGKLVGRLAVPVAARLGSRTEGVLIEVGAGPAVSGRAFRAPGLPLPGARVSIWGNFGVRAEITADARGAYRIEGLMPGPQVLSATAAGFIRANRTITVADQDLPGIDLLLQEGAQVQGRVLDAREQPCGGALVEVEVANQVADLKATERPVRTDEDGRFSLSGLAPGAAALHADGSLRGRADLDLDKLAAGERRAVTVHLSATGAQVSGTVRWKDGGLAAGIEVVAGNLRVDRSPARSTTGVDGSYRLGPFDTGAILNVQPEFRSGTTVDPPSGHRTVRVEGGRDVGGVDFTLARSDQTIRGLVLGPDGQPLPGAVVGTSGRQGRAVTDPDGRFVLDGLAPGTHDLRAEYPGLVGQTVADVPAGGSDLRIQLRRGALLAGAVEGAPGRAAGACSVWTRDSTDRVEGPDSVYRAVCAAGGAFELRGLRPGSYDLYASTLDGRTGSLPGIAVADGEQRRGLRLRATAGITALGTAVDLETRQPIAGVRVHVDAEGSAFEGPTGADGRFRLDDLPRGLSLDLRVEVPGYLPNSQARFSPGSADTVDFGTLPLLKERPGPPSTGRAGIVLSLGPEGALTVTGTVEDLPAARAGVTSGDVVIGIDGHDLTNVNLPTAVALIRGPSGAPLTLQLRGPDRRVRTVRIVRA